MAKNIEWIREAMLVGSEGELDKDELSVVMLRFLLENDEHQIKEVLRMFDKTEGLQKGSGLFLFRYLIAKKELSVDLTKKIDIESKVKNLLI